jgi:hypothetical protein
MSDLYDPLRENPAAPVRLWPGGPIDIEHYRRRGAQLRAQGIAKACRGLWSGLRRVAMRGRRAPAPFRAEPA